MNPIDKFKKSTSKRIKNVRPVSQNQQNKFSRQVTKAVVRKGR